MEKEPQLSVEEVFYEAFGIPLSWAKQIMKFGDGELREHWTHVIQTFMGAEEEPIRTVVIKGDVEANMVETDCFTEVSMGKILHQEHNGYSGSPDITEEQISNAHHAANVHNVEHPDHNIVVYEIHNTSQKP